MGGVTALCVYGTSGVCHQWCMLPVCAAGSVCVAGGVSVLPVCVLPVVCVLCLS